MAVAAAEAAAAMEDPAVIDDEEIAGLEPEPCGRLGIVQQPPKRR